MKQEFKETKSKKPCGACPFKKESTCVGPNPGGSHPFVYLGQTRGPFWLACHQDKNYVGKGSDPKEVGQCRGAAIFRANICAPYELPKELLSLPKDKETVFENEAEFAAHYLGSTARYHEGFLTKDVLDQMMNEEIYKPSEHKRVFK